MNPFTRQPNSPETSNATRTLKKGGWFPDPVDVTFQEPQITHQKLHVTCHQPENPKRLDSHLHHHREQ